MSNPNPSIPDWLITMPKVELHVHLEGTMSPTALWRLARHNGINIGADSEPDVARLFRFTDFTHFIDTFTTCSECIRSAAALGMLVEAYGAELARQNVRYAEIHFNPEPHQRRRGISMTDALAAMNRGRDNVRAGYGIELRWIADGVRDAASGPISAERTVDWMIDAGHESGIVALGLGGNEIGHPPHPFANAFRRARDAGFHLTAHAGEATGPKAIRDTLDCLGVARIGHGISAARDPLLLNRLASTGIALELCPTSNLRTGVAAALDDVPLRALTEHGVRFSIGSDDPPMFGTNLLTEYALVATAMELDGREMARLVSSMIDQSFADPATKAWLHRELRSHTPVD